MLLLSLLLLLLLLKTILINYIFEIRDALCLYIKCSFKAFLSPLLFIFHYIPAEHKHLTINKYICGIYPP